MHACDDSSMYTHITVEWQYPPSDNAINEGNLHTARGMQLSGCGNVGALSVQVKHACAGVASEVALQRDSH